MYLKRYYFSRNKPLPQKLLCAFILSLAALVSLIGTSLERDLSMFENVMVALLTGYASGYIFYYVNIVIENAEKEDKILHSCAFLWGVLLSSKEKLDENIPKIDYNNAKYIEESNNFISLSIKEIKRHINRNFLYVQSNSYEMQGILFYISDEIEKFENIDPSECEDNRFFPFYYKGYLSCINKSLKFFENLDTFFDDGNEMLKIMYKQLIMSECAPVSAAYLTSRMKNKIGFFENLSNY